MVMKPTERDSLLIRLDERSKNIYNLSEKQERHLAELNNKVAKNVADIAVNCSRLDYLTTNSVSVRLSRKQVIVGGSSVAPFVALVLIELGKLLNWW